MTLIPQPSILLRSHWFSKLLIILWHHWYKLTHYYPTSDTATLMIWYSWHNNLLYYYTWLDTTTFIYNTWCNNKYTYMMILDTAISILWYWIQQSHLLIYNNDSASFLMPLWFSGYNTNKLYSTTDTTTLIPWYPWYNNNLYCYILLGTIRVMQYEYNSLSQSYPEQGDRLPAAGGPPPMRIPGAARRTPRHYPRLWISCYYIVFFCFAICVIRYPPIRRPISR